MVHCEHCGKTDGCSFQDFHGTTLCIRCYRAARDREFEERKNKGTEKAETPPPREVSPERTKVRSMLSRLWKREE